MDILRKIWKYKFHYVMVIPAVLLLIYFKGIPLVMTLLSSFKQLRPAYGLADSPWVGWDNYRQLWESMEFANVLGNTLTLKLLYIVLSGVLAFILALALSSIQSVKLRNVLQSIILLPYFIPTVVLAYMATLILSVEHSPFFKIETLVLTDPSLWRVTVMLIELVSTVGIPVMIGAAAIYASSSQSNSSRVYSALRAIVAFMLLQLTTLLSFDLELVYSLMNAMVLSVSETVETQAFRIGFHLIDLGPSAALWMIQFAVQLVLTILIYLLIRRWFISDLFHQKLAPPANGKMRSQRSYIGLIVTILYGLIAIAPLCFLIIYPWFGAAAHDAAAGNSSMMSIQYAIYLFLTLIVVIVYMFITMTLAYPLTVKDLPGRNLYKLFLLIILTANTISVQEFYLYRNMGLMNTIFAPLFSGIMSVIGVFVLKSIFNRKYAHLKQQATLEGRGEMYSFFMLFIPKVWKPLIALGVLQFITIWNSYFPSLVLISNPSVQSPLGSFYFMMMANPTEVLGPGMVMKVGLIVSLPALLLFIIFRKWLTAEVLVGEVRK